eukprot:5291192-Prymnesium_polylepis.1
MRGSGMRQSGKRQSGVRQSGIRQSASRPDASWERAHLAGRMASREVAADLRRRRPGAPRPGELRQATSK